MLGEAGVGGRPGEEREAEVDDLRRARPVEKDVLGLDVPVHHPLVVRVLQRLADPRHDRQRFGRGEVAARHRLPQRDALDELHHEVVEALAVAEVIDADDVRVIQPRHRPRLAGEALRERRVVLQVRVQHLDGDGPVERPVARPVDGPHPAGPDQLEAVEVGQPALELLGRQRRGPPAPAVGLRGGFPAQPRPQRAVGADAGRRIDGDLGVALRTGSLCHTPCYAVPAGLLQATGDQRSLARPTPAASPGRLPVSRSSSEYGARRTAMMTATRKR